MLSDLIPRPQQPRIDMNTYFKPLIEDLKVLWDNHGVEV
jgi:hypothetical protein